MLSAQNAKRAGNKGDTAFKYSWMSFEEKYFQAGFSPLETKLNLGLTFIESKWNPLYGFFNCVSTSPNFTPAYQAIPNILDTCFILDALLRVNLPVNPVIKTGVLELLKRNMFQNGTFNYFIKPYSVIGNDLDTTSLSISTMFECGMEREEAKLMAENLQKLVQIREGGVPDIYFGVSKEQFENASECRTILQKWEDKPRTDLVATANFLYTQLQFVDNISPQLLPSFEILENALTLLGTENFADSDQLPYQKCYKNHDIVCYFIARMLTVSQQAKQRFQHKLAAALLKRLSLSFPIDNPLALSGRIIAALISDLHLEPATSTKIVQECGKLLKLQREDYSFEKNVIYMAHGCLYFGSESLSTALAISALKMAIKEIPGAMGTLNEILVETENTN